MNISHLQAGLASGRLDVQNSPEGSGAVAVARNREVAQAIAAINANEVFGPGSELRFSRDVDTGRSLVRIVDRATNEVLSQIPPEELLRIYAVLNEMQGQVHFA